MYIGLILAGMIAGVEAGIFGIVGGGFIMAVGMGLVYFWGAYDRAKTSDEIEARKIRNGNR